MWVVLGGEQQYIEQEGVSAATFGTNKTKLQNAFFGPVPGRFGPNRHRIVTIDTIRERIQAAAASSSHYPHGYSPPIPSGGSGEGSLRRRNGAAFSRRTAATATQPSGQYHRMDAQYVLGYILDRLLRHACPISGAVSVPSPSLWRMQNNT